VAGSSTPEGQQPKMLGCQQWNGEPEVEEEASLQEERSYAVICTSGF